MVQVARLQVVDSGDDETVLSIRNLYWVREEKTYIVGELRVRCLSLVLVLCLLCRIYTWRI